MMVGAMMGGKLMQIGRRRVQFFNIVIGLVGLGITQKFSYWTLLIGRFLFGLSTGLFSSTATRYMEETVPFPQMGAAYNMSINVGIMISFLLAEFLPDDKDIKALKTTERWRICYFWLPASIYCVIALSLFFTIRNDSIKNSIHTGNVEAAR